MTSDDVVLRDLRDLPPQMPEGLLPWDALDRQLDRWQKGRRISAVGGVAIAVVIIVVTVVSLGGGGASNHNKTAGGNGIANGPLLVSQHVPTPSNRFNTDLALVDPHSGALHPLMRDSINDADGAVSRDGQRVAYVAETASPIKPGVYQQHGTVHVVDLSGSNDRVVYTCHGLCTGLAWSPNGNELAAADDAGIVVIDVSGGAHQVCGSICGAGLSQPSWSPDGTEIAFARATTLGNSTTFGSTGYHVSAIWTAGTSGNHLSQLTNLGCTLARHQACTVDTAPAWSPDGTRIAFSRSTAQGQVVGSHGPPVGPKDGGIDVMSADGTADVSVYDCGRQSCLAPTPLWSPDGTRLAFIDRGAGPFSGGSGTVVVAPVPRGRPTVMPEPRHTHNQFYAALAWSPDGRKLAMLLSHGYHSRLLTARTNGSGLHELAVPHLRGYDGTTLQWASQQEGSRPSPSITSPAPTSCEKMTFPLSAATPESPSMVSEVLDGHVPARLPPGFGLQEVDRVGPNDAGYAAWTDDQCRRINVYFDPGQRNVTTPSQPAFGPWHELQRCGKPRPCIVYEAAVNGGVITFSTWQLDPHTSATILRTVATGPHGG